MSAISITMGIPFSKKKESYPSILDDGNTVAWFDMAESYITKDGSDFVSQWSDRSGLNHHLLQVTGTNQPLWSSTGVLFDGIDNFMKCSAFTLVQPEMIYLVFRQVTWTNNDRIFDGEAVTEILFQQSTTPGLKANSGTSSTQNDNLAVNTFGIIRLLFNGASSKLIINETTPVTGDFGSSNMGGFTLGSTAPGTNYWSNIQVKEVIIRKIADASGDEIAIYNYLKSKYSL